MSKHMFLVSKGEKKAASLPKMLLLFVEINFFFFNAESVWKEQGLYIFLPN